MNASLSVPAKRYGIVLIALLVFASALPFFAHGEEIETPVAEVPQDLEVPTTPSCAEGEEFDSETQLCVPLPVEEEPAPMMLLLEVPEEEEKVQEDVQEEESGLQCVIVSDTLTQEGEDAAVLISELSGYWSAVITDASWIWGEDPAANQEVTSTETFTRSFELPSLPSGGSIEIAADDGYVVSLNGTEIGSDTGMDSVNFTQEGKDYYVIPTELFIVGTNVLTIEATNIAWNEGGANPGALLYRLEIDGIECGSGQSNDDSDENSGGGSYTKKIKKSGGEVLGATTDACTPLLSSYLGAGRQNDAGEVMKLQGFLNADLGLTLALNGSFDTETTAAVHTFQQKYWEDVLKPWFGLTGTPAIVDADDSTGFVYKTTKWKINNIVCPGSEAMPALP